MWAALQRGSGMAQFSHPEFGGSGQWMRNGLVMVGDMFNRGLALRVDALCEELAPLVPEHADFVSAMATANIWWPKELGLPATTGAQSDMRYAWFPEHRTLLIDRGGQPEAYDMADHLIRGVSQQQGGSPGTMSFSSQHGPIDLATLKRIGDVSGRREMASDEASRSKSTVDKPVDRASAAASETMPLAGRVGRQVSSAPDILETIDRLADLHARGVLTEEEFVMKKTELLARL